MLLKPAAAACAGGSWRGEPRRRGGLYSLEQPESAAGLELRLPAWPLPSSGSLLGQEEVVGAARSSGGLGRAGMGCSRCSWLGPCRARPLRVGMGPPHLPETFLRAACSALGEAERDFQERGGSPSSAQLVFPPAKNAARLCTWGELHALLTPGQPPPGELLPCSPLLGLTPCPAGPAWSPPCPQGPVGTAPGCAGGFVGLGTSPRQWLQVP